MIPKIIHYCWLSGAPWGEVQERCYASWQRHLPGYAFERWDAARVPAGVPFLEKMLRHRQWAFASDYLRLHALHQFGGIYLDLDVEVLRSFDDLLENQVFLGREDPRLPWLGCHALGAAPHHPLIAQTLRYYRGSWRLAWSFPPTMPRILTRVAERSYGYRFTTDQRESLQTGILVLPAASLSPLSYHQRSLPMEGRIHLAAAESYCLHHWLHGWDYLEHVSLASLRKLPWLFMGRRDWWHVARRLTHHWRVRKSSSPG